ncbi:translesion DNA synthesis-associated protein ImuA [Catenovulum sediminis]|uniref:Translesion DNA synthesis-associated protein ImuA n=1 Tax=Catenovulum sediminis TaxID=1740262 RepID=A0ABV1RIE1_9ALTE|nr:translesion DNA synthesis-associated protein ImuA [Catenovulum sediminis]
MNKLIEYLENKQLVWHGAYKKPQITTSSSGYHELDSQLEGGFAATGVIEILSDIAIGELRLLLPSLLKQNTQQKFWIFIAAPACVNAQMLVKQGFDLNKVLFIQPTTQQEILWAAELCLKSGCCCSVLMWPHKALDVHQIKRLQLACEKGNSRTFILRQQRTESISLPFDLSLSLKANESGLLAKVNKRRYAWPSEYFAINMQAHWPELVKQNTLKQALHNVIEFPFAREII